jgi:phage terminase large subunit
MPEAFQELWQPARFKVFWGGRGSAKSWSFAQALVCRACVYPIKVLCVREYQTSIKDSVHAILAGQISRMKLGAYFKITERGIASTAGAEFIFNGLHHNVDQIKSTEGVDICWVEEAHAVTEDSWKYLIPTIRSEGRFDWLPTSEIWVSFNQHDDTDPTFVRFVAGTPQNSVVKAVTWEDNPYFPGVLDDERRYMLETDPDAYDWVWGTQTRRMGSSVILKGHCVVRAFEEPTGYHAPQRIFLGADWGFANDPTALIRSYMTTEADGDHLWITHEAFGWGVELDDLPALFEGGTSQDGERTWEGVPGVHDWPIKADGSRPETISYMARKGFRISAAEKWPGSVEDGVAHLKRFRKIHIHDRCKHIAQESRLYSYKVDKRSGDVMPVINDRHNHGIDGVRYSLDGYIQRAGGLGVWSKLAG